MFGIVVSTAACSNSEAGTPVPRESGLSGTGSETDPPPGTGNVPPSLAEVDPCELLSSSDRAQLDVEDGDSDEVAGARLCHWKKSGEFAISVALHDDLGFRDANMRGATPVPIDVGKHEAYKVENLGGGDGHCNVFLVVSESSFALVGGTTSAAHDTPRACSLTTQLAQIVDPKLP